MVSFYIRAFALLLSLSSLLGASLSHAQTALTVTTLADEFGENEEACGLREAIQSANTQSSFGGCLWSGFPVTITLPAGTYALSRIGAGEDANATGDLDVLADVAVVGGGAEVVVLDGLAQDRVVQVFEGATVEVSGVTITNGRTTDGTEAAPDSESGGGIFNAGNLTLSGCAVSENATGNGGGRSDGFGEGGSSGDGGGIYNAVAAAFTLSACVLESNETGDGGDALLGEGGDGGDGGAIYSAGAVTLYRSALLRNKTGDGGQGMGFPGTGGRGGGLFNEGEEVNIEESEISENRTSDHYDYGRLSPGGGIASLSGSVRIVRSTLSQNQTRGYGGGLYVLGDTLEVVNSTFSGNRAFTYGGGLALLFEASATLEYLTVYNNSIYHDPSYSGSPGGGGIFVGDETTVQIRNSILAGNLDLYSYPQPGPSDCRGPLLSEGYNIIGNRVGCSGNLQPTDQSGTYNPDEDNSLDPLLLPLADNGGPTPTHLPESESPAVDTGSCTDIAGNPITTDQRGLDRPFGEACDVGSVEREIETAVDPTSLPERTLQLRVHPNPALSSATVTLTLRRAEAKVMVETFDILGRRVAVLHEGTLAAGEHRFALDTSGLPAGLYVVRAIGKDHTLTQRVTVVR